MSRQLRTCTLVVAALAHAPLALAQYNDDWLHLTQLTGKLAQPSGAAADLVTNTDEKDFAVGDINHDGWPDLLVAKKVQVSFPGPRPARLFVNEKGTLVDRTLEFGTASLSAADGDAGFSHPLDARDLEIGDLDSDGWEDVLSVQNDFLNQTSAAAKRITHPRVYMNLANDPSGQWLGLRHEDARIPQLITVGGLNGVVRFMDGALGDVDLDGDLDLYCVDFDLDENGHAEPANLDLDDRLLINDGNGFFTDETAVRFSNAGMWSSKFGSQCDIVDMNLDGKPDILKIVTLVDNPTGLEAIYNDIVPGVGVDVTGNYDSITIADSGENWGFATTDLNRDGRPDLAIGDYVADHYVFNVGTSAGGQATWAGIKNFTYLTGSSDEGFMGQMASHDYDLDGWNDVLICDMSLDVGGCTRRTKIFHNRGGVAGATNIVLAEEKQQSGSGGWFGAVGWSVNYPKGVNDVASIDFDRDGDLDLILGRCAGTDVWRNETNPVTCQPTAVPTSLGDGALGVCGAPLYSNLTATLEIENGPPSGVAVMLLSLSPATNSFGGGSILQTLQSVFALPLDAAGNLSIPVPGGGGPQAGVTVYLQALLVTPGAPVLTDMTNVVGATVFD